MLWHSTYHRRIAQVLDIFTAMISFISAYYFSKVLHNMAPSVLPPNVEIRNFNLLIIFVLSVIYEILFNYEKAYNYQRFTSLLREHIIVLKVCVSGFLISIASIYFLNMNEIPKIILMVFFVVSIFLFAIEKTILFYLASYVRKKGRNRKKVILIGTGTRAANFIKVVKSNFNWGLDILGVLTGDLEKIGKEVEGIKVLDHYNNLPNTLKTINPEEIVITISTKRFNQIRDVLEICEREGVSVRLNSDFLGRITKNVTVDNVFGLNIISFKMVRQSEAELFVKRLIDIVGSLSALIVFSPFMIFAAIGILVSDGFPIFYTFVGYGLNKKPIKIIKFRTMVKNSEEIKEKLLKYNEMEGPVFKIKNDPRIIRFGRWLRKFSIDETPQLFCVLKGDLSLVGPRQAMKEELENYESWQRRRLSVKPGLTCLWQVNGRNKIRNFNDWTKLDLEYIDNWSIWLDIRIILKTIPVVLFGHGS